VKRFGRHAIRFFASSTLVAVAYCGLASAQTDELSLRQLNHRAFTVADGAPADIVALAQGPDGTLWIGGRTGLVRFDGVSFVPYPGPGDEPLGATNVTSLLAGPDGSLWIGFRPEGVSVLKQGRVTRYGPEDGLPSGAVQLARDLDGSIWAATRTGLAHFDGHRWRRVSNDPLLATPYDVRVDRAGTVWVAAVDGLLARPAGEQEFRLIDSGVYSDAGGVLLAEAPDGHIYAAADDRLVQPLLTAGAKHQVTPVLVVAGGPLLVDSSGNLWASEGSQRSLVRVRARELGLSRHHDALVEKEGLPLSGARVYALLEDRERNVWVGTNAGLHRFSRANVVRDVTPQCVQYAYLAAAIVPGDDGALWLACGDPSDAYLAEARDGEVSRLQTSPFFTAVHRDPEGTIWFGGPTALGHLEEGRVVTALLPPDVSGRPIQGLTRDADGALWASVTRRGTYRIVDGVWQPNGGLEALPEEWALVQSVDESGTLWFGYPSNRLARIAGKRVELFGATHGLDVGNPLAILARDGEVWVGGELGFARFDGARFVPIRDTADAAFKGVSGIVKTREGDLWLNGAAGITHIAREEVEQVIRDPNHRVRHETFDHLDGVPGTAVQLRPQPSAIETTDGRLWFSTTGGIVSIDPARIARNNLPPAVTIWSLTSGGERRPNLGELIRLPVHTTDLQIEYTAGSLTVPERVRFRYKLEGFDRDWQDVGPRREARYTNVGPGRYTFRVAASNNDGVWNDTGASIEFTIAPAFYQTGWFYALCALAGLAFLVTLYTVRVRQVAAQLRGRLEARLAERERIARELHDTLLQGMQGLIWRFQAATDRIPATEPARQLMEKSLDRADELLAEGRDKVKQLRVTVSDMPDLAKALAAEGEQLAEETSVEFRAIVDGVRRELHPMVREEGFLIGREALGNAFRHARAERIEVEVSYGRAALHVRVRDDGAGIDPVVLAAGERPGHFGLIGMRERATRIGGEIQVWSKPGAGTEVDLRVPARVAYGRSSKAFQRLRREENGDG
jgi:signal transduction histidine kinase/ligand-binding sensor domain-containing protein